jgi:hypothetical protein
MLSGCGIGGVVVIAAVTGGDSGSGKSGFLPPNNVPVVYVNTPDRQVGDVTISYRLTDLDGDNCSVTITYGTNGADPATPATPAAASPPTVDLDSSAAGVDHTFVWDSATDAGSGLIDGARISISANDGLQSSPVQTTDFFMIGNDAPEIETQTPAGAPSRDIAVFYSARDTTSDLVSIELEFRPDSSTPWAAAAPVAGTVTTNLMTDNAAGVPHVFVWDSLDNVGGVASTVSDQCQVRIRATDLFTTGAWSESNAFTIHNNFPPTADILEVGTPGVVPHRGVIPISYRLFDTEGEAVDVAFEWSADGSAWKPMTEYPAGSGAIELSEGKYGLPASPGGNAHRFFWNSLADTQEDHSFVWIRVVPSDPGQEGVPEQVLFNSKLQNFSFGMMTSSHYGTVGYNVLAAGDFDDNGYPDIVFHNESNTTFQILNGGPNAFSNESDPINADTPYKAVTGDFCYDDGVDDLALVSLDAGYRLYVFRGESGKGLTILVSYLTPANIRDLATGDFDNNGITDIAAGVPGFVYIFEGRATGFPVAAQVLAAPGSDYYKLTAEDMDEDGIDDLILCNSPNNSVYIWPGKTGGFPDNASRVTYSTGGFDGLYHVVCADFNGDNHTDMAVNHQGHDRITYWPGRAGNLPDNAAPSFFDTGAWEAMDHLAFDFNLDGCDEIVYVYPHVPMGPIEHFVVPGSPAGPDIASVTHHDGERLERGVSADILGIGVPQLTYSAIDGKLRYITPVSGSMPDHNNSTVITDNAYLQNFACDVSGDGIDDLVLKIRTGSAAAVN